MSMCIRYQGPDYCISIVVKVSSFELVTRVTSCVRFNTKGAKEAEMKNRCDANDVGPYIFIQAFKE